MKVYLGPDRIRLDPASSLGQGGEAEVFDIGGGRALKLFKDPKHPDFAGDRSARALAEARLEEHQRKLPAFPTGLPARVVVPEQLATNRARGGRIVGYAMRKVEGAVPMHRFADPRFRRTAGAGNRGLAALRDLRAIVKAVHDAGVVIGDFNDLNVLVAGSQSYLIDADSFQLPGFVCRMFTERFVDPLRCAANEVPLSLIEPHDVGSDWYAFAVIGFRTLLCVDPYGGVHRPNSGPPLAAARRRHARVTVLDPQVIYPRPALAPGNLPDELLGYFEAVFHRDDRTALPAELLDDLRWTRCAACGREHARATCPGCIAGTAASRHARVKVRGSVTAERIAKIDGVLIDVRLSGGELRWLSWAGGRVRNRHGQAIGTVGPAPGRSITCFGDGALIAEGGRARLVRTDGESEPLAADLCGAVTCAVAQGPRLVRAVGGAITTDGPFGEIRCGRGLRNGTRLWASAEQVVGFYRAGALAMVLLARPPSSGITEVALPPLRGNLLEVGCVIGDRRIYLHTVTASRGVELARCVVIERGAVIAVTERRGDDPGWLASLAGACAIGDLLFVPTDDGLIRVEASGGALEVRREFPDTAPFVDAASRLLAGPSGLYAAGQSDITRLSLSSNPQRRTS